MHLLSFKLTNFKQIKTSFKLESSDKISAFTNEFQLLFRIIATQSKISAQISFLHEILLDYQLSLRKLSMAPWHYLHNTTITLVKLYACYVQTGNSLRKGLSSEHPTPKNSSVKEGDLWITMILGLCFATLASHSHRPMKT